MYYAFSENYILPYSHDEVVHGKLSMIGKMFGDYYTKFAALKTLYGWLYGHPGKKLLFMGSEFAQFIEWDYKKELDWFLLDYETHAGMQKWVKALNRLYREHSALYARDDGWDGFQWLCVEDRKNNVFAFMRYGGEERVACVYNFSGRSFPEYRVAMPESGRLKLLLSSDAEKFGGGGHSGDEHSGDGSVKKTVRTRKNGLNGLPCSAGFSLPGYAALFYEFIPFPRPPVQTGDCAE